MIDKNVKIHDTAIIGAGPVGLFAIFELGLLGLSSVVIDGLAAVGGQCRALYAEKPIFDIPAHPDILAGDLVDKLWAQASKFNPELILGTQVEQIEKEDDHFILFTNDGRKAYARTIIIAAGAGAFLPNRPPLENIETYENKSVFYFVEKTAAFKDEKVVIAGGGDSALDWANILCEIADVTLVHRRPKFRAAPDSVRLMEDNVGVGKINLVTPAQLKSLHGDHGHLTHITIDQGGCDARIEADILLPFFGLMPSLGSIERWGLDIDAKTISVDQGTSATNIKGIYAIGDIAGYPHKLKLIMTGFAESAQAAHAIYAYLNPDKPLHFVHSTDKANELKR